MATEDDTTQPTPQDPASPAGSQDQPSEAVAGDEARAPDIAATEGDAQAITLPSFDEVEPGDDRPAGLDLLSDVNLNVKIELGRTRMLVEDVLRLKEGGVVELEKLAGDPVDIYVNDRPVARGEVLVLNDNFCVRISEILDTEKAGKRPA